MRIAMVGSRGVPAHYGGVETAVQELALRLVQRGHEVTVYCWASDYDERPEWWQGIRTRYVGTTGGRISGASLAALGASLDTLARDYDIIHYHAMGPTLFAPLARLRARNVVATVQGRDDRRAKWGPSARRFMRVAAWSTARVPHRTIVVSEELRDEFREEFRRETTYLPNGISPVPEPAWTEGEQHAAVRRLGLEPGGYLLNVSRLTQEKRHDVLLRGFAVVPDDVALALVGDARHAPDYLRTLNELVRLDPRVTMTGPVYGQDLDAVFRHALGFVTASGLEGLPLTMLEACSYGLPVVASDIRPHREVVADHPGARLFAAGDPAAATRAIIDLLGTDPLTRSDEASKLRDDVLTRYDWETITDRTVELYASLLS